MVWRVLPKPMKSARMQPQIEGDLYAIKQLYINCTPSIWCCLSFEKMMFSMIRPFSNSVVSFVFGLILTGFESTIFGWCLTGFSLAGFSRGLVDCLTVIVFEAWGGGSIVPSTKAMNTRPEVKASLLNSESIKTAYLYPMTYSSST